MYCSRCGLQYFRETAKFCPHCGSVLDFVSNITTRREFSRCFERADESNEQSTKLEKTISKLKNTIIYSVVWEFLFGSNPMLKLAVTVIIIGIIRGLLWLTGSLFFPQR